MTFTIKKHAPHALEACGGKDALYTYLRSAFPMLRILRIYGSEAGEPADGVPAVVIAYRVKTVDQHGNVATVGPAAQDLKVAALVRFPGVRFVMVPTVGHIDTPDVTLAKTLFGRVLRTMWGCGAKQGRVGR